jgi:hypothetical protein
VGLQQLFRVRRLKDRGMYLLARHPPRREAALLHGGDRDALSQDISLVAKHSVSNQLTFFSQIHISGERIE